MCVYQKKSVFYIVPLSSECDVDLHGDQRLTIIADLAIQYRHLHNRMWTLIVQNNERSNKAAWGQDAVLIILPHWCNITKTCDFLSTNYYQQQDVMMTKRVLIFGEFRELIILFLIRKKIGLVARKALNTLLNDLNSS